MNGNGDGGAHGGVGVVDVSKLILNDDNFPSLSSSSSTINHFFLVSRGCWHKLGNSVWDSPTVIIESGLNDVTNSSILVSLLEPITSKLVSSYPKCLVLSKFE